MDEIYQELMQTLQRALEGSSDYAFRTRDKTIYTTPEYHLIKQLFCVLAVGHKQKAATNYGGGAPSGGDNNGHS